MVARVLYWCTPRRNSRKRESRSHSAWLAKPKEAHWHSQRKAKMLSSSETTPSRRRRFELDRRTPTPTWSGQDQVKRSTAMMAPLAGSTPSLITSEVNHSLVASIPRQKTQHQMHSKWSQIILRILCSNTISQSRVTLGNWSRRLGREESKVHWRLLLSIIGKQ